MATVEAGWVLHLHELVEEDPRQANKPEFGDAMNQSVNVVGRGLMAGEIGDPGRPLLFELLEKSDVRDFALLVKRSNGLGGRRAP